MVWYSLSQKEYPSFLKGILFLYKNNRREYRLTKLLRGDVFLAKISRSAIEKRLIANSQTAIEPTKEEINEAMLRKFKKETKREFTMERYRMHEFFMTKKEKRIYKQKLSKIKF